MGRIFNNLWELLHSGSSFSFNKNKTCYFRYPNVHSLSSDEHNAQQKAGDALHTSFGIIICGKGDMTNTLMSLDAQEFAWFSILAEYDNIESDYIILLSPGDILAPDALLLFAEQADLFSPDIIYSDEDSIIGNRHINPLFKPDFSEITALSYDLIGRSFAVKRELFEKFGAGISLTNPDSRYGFVMRCLSEAKHILHIPRVLLSAVHGSNIVSDSAMRKGIESYLVSSKQRCSISPGLWRGSFRVGAVEKSKHTAIIIPISEHSSGLKRLLESIEYTCCFHRPDIIIAYDGSSSPDILKYVRLLESKRLIKAVHSNGGFAALCNAGAAISDDDAYLFLSPDIELITPDITFVLAEQGFRRNAGAVGCTLTDSSDRLLYLYGVPGFTGTCGSPFSGLDRSAHLPHMDRFAKCIRSVTFLSGVCLYVKAELFHSVGGFDESFDGADPCQPCGSDAALCAKLAGSGFCNIFTPFARAVFHGDPATLNPLSDKQSVRCADLLRKYSDTGDPNFNKNFSLKFPDLRQA